jgi:hypothetical protein
MSALENIKEFFVTQFSNIMLSVTLIFFISSTVEIGKERDPKNIKDKLNLYYGLNVTGLVFLSLFIVKEYIMSPLK